MGMLKKLPMSVAKKTRRWNQHRDFHTHNAPIEVCDDTGWMCEEHPGRPWRGASKRADASDCCGVGMPCAQCNPCGGTDEPSDISRSVMRVRIDA
jgi:hypothetical protein